MYRSALLLVSTLFLGATATLAQGADTQPPICENGFNPFQPIVNGLAFDFESGLASIELSPGSFGLVLTLDPFTPGDQSATFLVTLDPASLSASGGVLLRDVAGNEAICGITLNCSSTIAYSGVGVPGNAGVTPLVTSSCASIGQPVDIATANGRPFASGCVGFGWDTASTPIAGGLILIDPIALFPHVTDGNGDYLMTLQIPDDAALLGSTVFWQAAYVDPAATGAVAFSTRLSVTFGG